MQYVRIANYTLNDSTFQEIAEKAKTGLLRKFQEQPGFIRYGLVDTGEQHALSMSFWNTREEAIASETVAATWISENLSGKVLLKSSYIGTLAFLEGVPAAV